MESTAPQACARIIPGMRHLLLALLIALLPLRGLVGDAMAMQMLAPAGHAMDGAEAAAPAHGHDDLPTQAADDAGPCPGHMAQAPDDAAPTHAGTAECGTCTACQICHTVALAVRDVPEAALAVAPSPPRAGGERFASVTPAPGLKPPIS